MLFKRLQKHLLLCVSALLILPNSLYAVDAEIVQSAFARSIKNHQPVNVVQQLNNNISKIYFFTDMRNFQGQTLTHEWSLNGWVAQSIPFEVKGNRWRVSSNKSLKPRSKGTWTVKVLDEQGNIIKQASVSYHKLQAPAAKKKPPETAKTQAASKEVSAPKKAVSVKKESPKSTASEKTTAKAKNETKVASEPTVKKSNKANTDNAKKVASKPESEKSESKTVEVETEKKSKKSADAKKDTASSIQAAVIESYDSDIVEDDECTDDHDHEAEHESVGKQQLSDE
jgi:hypothetical protein